MEGFGRSQTGSISLATTPVCGGHDSCELASGCAGGVSPRLGQAADLAVAQAVVDEGEKLAGAGDSADRLAPAVSDAMAQGGDWCGAVLAADSFDRSPAHQPGALLGDVTPRHVGVGLAVSWGEPPLCQTGLRQPTVLTS